jgi:CRP-like cAMP-binding protein
MMLEHEPGDPMNEHIAYYARLLDRNPGNVDARLRLAALWRSEGASDRAVRQYAAAARLLARDGLLLEAIAACKAIFEMDPTHTETQLFLASLYARRPESETVAQVIAAVQPGGGGGTWPGSDELDRIVGMDEDTSQDDDSGSDSEEGLIVLEAKDAVLDIDEMEFVEVDVVEGDGGAPEASAGSLFDPDEDQITSELDRVSRTSPAPPEPDVTPYTPLNVKRPEARAGARLLATSEKSDTTPIRARQKPSLALTYPERVLRRALSLTADRGGNRADLSEVGPAPVAPGDEIFPPPSEPQLTSRPTAAYTEVESGVVSEILAEVTPQAAPSRMGGSDVYGAETVLAQVRQSEPARSGMSSSESTRVERPPPPQPGPMRAEPEDAEYASVEVVSPAALSVSRADVPANPLFSSLSPWAFVEILKRIDLRRVPSGQAISEPSQRPRGLFIIVNGDVEVVRKEAGGDTKYLATLHRGDFFGEFELLTGRSHQAVVRAVNSVDLLHLSEEVIIDLAEHDPTIWDVLWNFYHDRLLNNMLAGSEIFGCLDPEEREDVSKEFRLVEMVEDQVVVRQGEEGKGIYLILSGEVEIVHSHAGEEEAVAHLRDGEFFGTVSTMTEGPRRATVRSKSEVTLLLLERENLLAIAARKPGVRAALDDLVSRRRLLMGETSYAKMYGFGDDS